MVEPLGPLPYHPSLSSIRDLGCYLLSTLHFNQRCEQANIKREEKPSVIRPSFLQLQREERRLHVYRPNSIQHPLRLQYGVRTRCQLYTRQLPLQINALVAQPDGNKKQLFIMSEVITYHWGALIVLQLET